MEPRIRPYVLSDAEAVGRLIADTFRWFNLSYASPEEQEKLLGPFRHADSSDAEHRAAIAATIDAPWVLVAENPQGILSGVLRGRPGRLHSLFVDAAYQHCGIGRRLMEAFEQQVRKTEADKITLQSTLLAVPFYQKLGYKRSTGVRSGRCFDGDGFRYQPMKKLL